MVKLKDFCDTLLCTSQICRQCSSRIIVESVIYGVLHDLRCTNDNGPLKKLEKIGK